MSPFIVWVLFFDPICAIQPIAAGVFRPQSGVGRGETVWYAVIFV